MKKRMFYVLLAAAAISAVTPILLAACETRTDRAPSAASTTGSITAQIPSPLLEHGSIQEISDTVGFTFIVPIKLPEGYIQGKIISIDKQIAEIFYMSGENKIAYRMAKGSRDISGDYSTYPVTKSISAGSLSINAKMRDNLVYSATWTSGGMCFSIYADAGITESQLSEMITSIK